MNSLLTVLFIFISSMEKKIEFIKNFIESNNYGFVPIIDNNSIDIIYNVLNGTDVKTIPETSNNLVCLYIGRYFDINKNYKESYDWYLKSAMNGNIYAQLHLNKLYYDGNEIIKQNLEEARKWHQMVLDNKDINNAQCVLAIYYYKGQYDFSKDTEKALEIWKQLSERGEYYSLANLGTHYIYIDNIDNAIKYYTMAIEKGCGMPMVIYNLSDIYEKKKDYANAMKWLEVAHKKEYPEAKEKIKLLLQNGDAAIQLINANNKLQEENNNLKQENAELAIMPSDTFKAYTEYMEKANTRKRRRNSF